MRQTLRERVSQFARFCAVGVVAAGIHYGVYFLMQFFLHGAVGLNVSYTVGYGVSLVCNFFMTTWFTFRSHVSAGKVAGFGFSHVVNYSIHIVLFNLLMVLGVHRLLAPVLVLMVAVPTNFLILRFVYRRK